MLKLGVSACQMAATIEVKACRSRLLTAPASTSLHLALAAAATFDFLPTSHPLLSIPHQHYHTGTSSRNTTMIQGQQETCTAQECMQQAIKYQLSLDKLEGESRNVRHLSEARFHIQQHATKLEQELISEKALRQEAARGIAELKQRVSKQQQELTATNHTINQLQQDLAHKDQLLDTAEEHQIYWQQQFEALAVPQDDCVSSDMEM